jgi:RND superfamily putative drug exporter
VREVLSWPLSHTALSLWQAPSIISRTSTAFDPPAASLAAKGDALLQQSFNQTSASTFALYCTGNSGPTWTARSNLTQFSLALNTTVYDLPDVVVFQGLDLLKLQGLPSQAWARFQSDDGSATFFSLVVNRKFSDPSAITWAGLLQGKLELLRVRYIPEASCTLLGVPAFIPVLLNDVELNLGLVDAITIPLALLLFALMLKSLRLMVFPLLSMGVSLSVSFAATTVLTYVVSVMSYLPSLLMSICIAMSFDYSLFLLLRYREELFRVPKGTIGETDVANCVTVMLATAGHTIAVSGLILALTFVATLVMPLEFVAVTGGCAAFCIFVSLAVNLTIAPCLLLAFPMFFSRAVQPFACCAGKCHITFGSRPAYQSIPSAVTVSESEQMAAAGGHDEASMSEADLYKMRQSHWYRLGVLNTKPLTGILFILLVLLFVAPFAVFCYRYELSADIVQDLPRDSTMSAAYSNFTRDFGVGLATPLNVLLTARGNRSLIDKDVFVEAAQLVRAIANATNSSLSDFSGVVYNDGFPAPFWYALYSHCHQPGLGSQPQCKAVLLGDSLFLNASHTATTVLYASRANPLRPAGNVWLQEARAQISKSTTLFDAVLVGQAVDAWDSINAIAAFFPIIMGCSAGIVLLVLAIIFGSVLVALRSVLTLALTLSFVYGATTLVYDYGALNWMGVAALSSSDGILWLVPVTCFSIIVGISLDYDVFLITRVAELRTLGHSTNDAIAAAQYHTGPVITVAGLIMAVAFSGMLFSSSLSLNQMGFMLAVSVLIDTFLVRTLFVPSAMALLGEANWWPRRLPLPFIPALPTPFGCCRRSALVATEMK